MTTSTTIELPRIDGESARAYAARVEYVTAGPQRSLEKLSQKSTKNIQLFKKWSSQYGWVSSAEMYDSEVALITVNEAADAYRSDLADYRKRYGDMGKALYSSAAKMLRKINTSLDSPLTELGVGSLITAINAAKTAADLESLALRVENLLNENTEDHVIRFRVRREGQQRLGGGMHTRPHARAVGTAARQQRGRLMDKLVSAIRYE